MYAQVIRGTVSDASAMKAAHDKWQAELRPGAEGVLGSTAGVAEDGTFALIARFSSEEAAQKNSDRPEQGAWWEETSKLFDGEPAFYNCSEVDLIAGGGSDDAGFVQFMFYKPNDLDAQRQMTGAFEKIMPMRPDILGGVMAVAADGTVIEANYFTSEADARAAEKQEMTPEVRSLIERFRANAGEITFVDLKDPWLD